MRIRTSLALGLLAALCAAAPAAASTADEIRAGQALADQLRAGTTSCAKLGSDDFEHVGEYVMQRMAGSLSLHEAMNERMRSVMGAANEERMHILMGRRYAGCGTVSGPMGWMHDGTWQHMTRADWQRMSDQWMGPGMMGRPAATGWWTAGHVALVVGGVLLAALAGGAIATGVVRRRTG